MAQRLFIQIHNEEYANWLVADDKGKIVSQSYFGKIQEAVPLAAGRQVIAFVPGQDITITSSQFPSRNRQKMRQGIPYAIEEKLVEDISDLHFAIGQAPNNQPIPVAIVSHNQMKYWMQILGESGLQANAMVPDSLSVPAMNGHWGVLLINDKALVHAGMSFAFSTNRENLSSILPRAIKEVGSSPESLLILDCDGNATNEEFGLDAENTVIERCEQGALPVLVKNYDSAETINLLQGEYSRREQIGKLWRPWKQSAILAAVFLFLSTSNTLFDFFRLNNEINKVKSANKDILLKTFPNIGRAVSPLKQMRQSVKKLKGSGDGGDGEFLSLLQKIAPAIKSNTIAASQMRYKKGQFDFLITAKSYPQLDGLKKVLEGMQFTYELKNNEPKGDDIEASIRIGAK